MIPDVLRHLTGDRMHAVQLIPSGQRTLFRTPSAVQPPGAPVAAGILPAVEGEHLAARNGVRSFTARGCSRAIEWQSAWFRRAGSHGSTAGRMPAATAIARSAKNYLSQSATRSPAQMSAIFWRVRTAADLVPWTSTSVARGREL